MGGESGRAGGPPACEAALVASADALQAVCEAVLSVASAAVKAPGREGCEGGASSPRGLGLGRMADAECRLGRA